MVLDTTFMLATIGFILGHFQVAVSPRYISAVGLDTSLNRPKLRTNNKLYKCELDYVFLTRS